QVVLSESARWRKLRRWVSLLLQLIFLLLLIAALTRPLWPWGSSPTDSVVIVIDGSASMRAMHGASSRFESAVAEAGRFAKSPGNGQEAAVVLANATPQVLTGWTDSRQELTDAFSKARPGNAASSPRQALTLAKNLATSRNGNVLFFTDGVWDGPLEGGILDGVTLHPIGAESPNAGISRFAARRSPALPGEVTVFAEVRNSGNRGGGKISLFSNSQLVDAREMAVTPGQPWRKEWILQEAEAVNLSAKIEGFADDALSFDEEFEITVEALPRVEAVLVSPPDRYLEAALAAVPALGVQRLWPPDTLKYGDASKLWIFQGTIPPPDFQALGLVMILPDQGGFFGELKGEMSEPWITEVHPAHDLTKGVTLDRVTVGRALDIQPGGGATTYVGSAGRPLIFGRWDADPRWLVVAMDPAKSDLVMRAAFPILISNVVQSLRQDTREFVSAEGASPALTHLKSHLPAVTDVPRTQKLGGSFFPNRPMWWWLLVLALVWIFGEWWTYHRRVTE
ncbi:MAG: VWA domain-containing protein, partial [Terrimicrobiaceae bacterium]